MTDRLSRALRSMLEAIPDAKPRYEVQLMLDNDVGQATRALVEAIDPALTQYGQSSGPIVYEMERLNNAYRHWLAITDEPTEAPKEEQR